MIREVLRTGYRSALQWLYAKREYKLFLRESIGAIDARTAGLIALADHFSMAVRPIPISPPFGRSALVLAPHQDDEAIGCGGALALQAATGGRVHLAVLQDGADGHEQLGLTRHGLRDLRNTESAMSAKRIGMGVSFLNFPNLIQAFDSAVEAIRGLLVTHDVDVVFTPWLLDAQADHEACNRILAAALAQHNQRVRVLCYEVWGLCLPNVVVCIDEVIEIKKAMLQDFVFANRAVDYTNSTLGLNMYRTRLLPSGAARYVEAFTDMPSQEFVTLEALVREGRLRS